MKLLLLLIFMLYSLHLMAQPKKPLDHTVYDGWNSIGEKMISNDGKFAIYTINPQEGDGNLVIQNPATGYKRIISRGYNAVITEDSKYLVFKIKPFYQDTRQAKIKKKKPDEMPKDSLGIIQLGIDTMIRIANVKSYKSPAKGFGWIAWQMDKSFSDSIKKGKTIVYDSVKGKMESLLKLADSIIKRSIDSVKGKIEKERLIEAMQKAEREVYKNAKDEAEKNGVSFPWDADGDDMTRGNITEGTDLVVKRMIDGKEKLFRYVSEYYFDKKGTHMVIETTRNSKDINSKEMIIVYDLQSSRLDTIMQGCNDCKNYTFDEEGNQLTYVAERDNNLKSLQKFYKLCYYKQGLDSAQVIADKNSTGMKLGLSISDNAIPVFSKDGNKVFFGTASIKPPKDTTLVDFELAKLDIWNYKDDYLQPQQLKNLDIDLKRSYLAVTIPGSQKVVQLGAEDAERIVIMDDGNADWVLGETTLGNRIEAQWTGRFKTTAYIISTIDGKRKLVKANTQANFESSPGGKYIYWYDPVKRNYFAYDVAVSLIRNVTSKIRIPLYEEEFDQPDYPSPYGIMGWGIGDSSLYIYDRYDVWKVDPKGITPPSVIFKDILARTKKYTLRYIKTDPEEKYFTFGQTMLYRLFDNKAKSSAMLSTCFGCQSLADLMKVKDKYEFKKVTYNNITKAKNTNDYLFSMESYKLSPDMYIDYSTQKQYTRLSDINPQQKEYNWGSSELVRWKTYNGKQSIGILYKPEDFDATKKYPMICYFYEKLSDGLYNYIPPAPTPSRLNISFYVSRGYLVFAPDISYTTGHPGKDAYNYIVSGVRALIKAGFVDSTKIAIQGQSWGGYQVTYLITATKLFAAAWAGAPVVNMTSAYGGIRWESGLNREFQYEKSQSRIGASLWEKPKLYIENSPLFYLPKVTTPVVIMSNDADGAVPWYQGIEMFTALRRLGKQVWLLQYNGEAHNLMERKNRKDIQIREQQFFDWKLKGTKPAKWLIEGVPAINKGVDWGMETD